MSTLEKAIKIAKEAHAGQNRWDNTPYFGHLEVVRNIIISNFGNTNYQIVAILHDLVEDHGDKWSFEDLLEAGFEKDIVDALRLLTRDKNRTYLSYLKDIIEYQKYSSRAHDYAISVKKADLQHNISCFKPEKRRGSMYDKYLLAQYILDNLVGR